MISDKIKLIIDNTNYEDLRKLREYYTNRINNPHAEPIETCIDRHKILQYICYTLDVEYECELISDYLNEIRNKKNED